MMTEHKIFEILLKNNENDDYQFDYPKLKEVSVSAVAKKISDVVYETLKQKSSASNIKRGNLLKLINNLCEVRESHSNKESYNYFLKIVEKSLNGVANEDISRLFYEIKFDLDNNIPKNVTEEVIHFHKKKHGKQKEKVQKLEYIKTMDQETLNSKYDIQVRKNFSYYETDENLIRELLAGQPSDYPKNESILYHTKSTDYREKQIKLAYALVNLKNEDSNLIEKIVQRLLRYEALKEFEINFLCYLWATQDDSIVSSEYLAEKFQFIIERIILKYSTEILVLNEEIRVDHYFFQLETDNKLRRIRKICNKNPLHYYKLKNLIYELYCYSYCNENILKLVNFIRE